jgi:hypothetical protein
MTFVATRLTMGCGAIWTMSFAAPQAREAVHGIEQAGQFGPRVRKDVA